jgi:hypothetical protein
LANAEEAEHGVTLLQAANPFEVRGSRRIKALAVLGDDEGTNAEDVSVGEPGENF